METHASLGPPWDRSNTCRGFRIHMNICSNFVPWETNRRMILETEKQQHSTDKYLCIITFYIHEFGKRLVNNKLFQARAYLVSSTFRVDKHQHRFNKRRGHRFQHERTPFRFLQKRTHFIHANTRVYAREYTNTQQCSETDDGRAGVKGRQALRKNSTLIILCMHYSRGEK